MVSVHTDALPGWVPVHARGDTQSMSTKLRDTLTALDEIGTAATAEIVDYKPVSITL
jgi:hypothetical protein